MSNIVRDGRAREEAQERRIQEMHEGLTQFLERCDSAHLTAPRRFDTPVVSTPFTPSGAPSRLRPDFDFDSPINQSAPTESTRNNIDLRQSAHPQQHYVGTFDYIRDEPPTIQRIPDEPQQHSTPRADPRTPTSRPRPALDQPRPRASSAPPSAHPAKRLAVQYLPTTEEITPPITPPRAEAKTPEKASDIEVVPDTPPPVMKPGRSRGRGTWRAQQKPAPRVGTRSMSRLKEIERRELEEAQAASARWPAAPDITNRIQNLTREMHITDMPVNTHAELERVFPQDEEDAEMSSRQPPAAGLISRQQDTSFIPPPSRAVGGVRGRSISVSTATLGLIHRQDPTLATQLREDPASMMSQRTRRRVYSTMRLIRTGLIGQMASLQQWEKAMNDQDEL